MCQHCCIYEVEERNQGIADKDKISPKKVDISAHFKWENVLMVSVACVALLMCFKPSFHQTLHLKFGSIGTYRCARPTRACKQAGCDERARLGEKYCLVCQAQNGKIALAKPYDSAHDVLRYGSSVHTISGWDEGPDALLKKASCRRWCSSCFQLCDHEPVDRDTALTSHIKWVCKYGKDKFVHAH